MCGISGLFNYSNRQPAQQFQVEKMVSALRHRGPDEYGVLLDGPVGLGMSRLSIIDLADGSQPISNEDESIWVTFNGEIFNYIELREDLEKKGHIFRSHSDTETIVHLYESYGYDFVNYLNGQFAIALWDSNKQELIVTRDRVGIRPLFYAKNNGTFYYASEIKSIFAAGAIRPEIDVNGLSQVFTFWANVPPATCFKNIQELPAGHILIFKNNQEHLKQFWNLHFPVKGDFSTKPRKQLEEELFDLILDAVTLRLRADVPVAAYLSGGIDSSIITSLVKKYHNNDLLTYSVAFHDKNFDERPYQDMIAKHLGTNHSTVR